MELIFASHNQNKVKEIRHILNNYQIISLKDLNDDYEVEENGETFKENAFLKANYYYKKYKKATFADDSGLVVEALNGEPGVHSARYASDKPSYSENNQLLLKKMQNITNRKAYFITVVCYIDHQGTVHYFEGRINGLIAYELKGSNGFGYDPLFKIPELNQTLAELSNEVKNSLSHRYMALKELILYLKKEGK